jgi:hypothetical protein
MERAVVTIHPAAVAMNAAVTPTAATVARVRPIRRSTTRPESPRERLRTSKKMTSGNVALAHAIIYAVLLRYSTQTA